MAFKGETSTIETIRLIHKLECLSTTNLAFVSTARSSMVSETFTELYMKAKSDRVVLTTICEFGARKIILQYLKSKWPEVVKSLAIATLIVLNKGDGNKPTLTSEEVELIFEHLEEENLLGHTLNWILCACRRHEKNKQIIYERGIMDVAVAHFGRHVSGEAPGQLAALNYLSRIVRALSTNDDIYDEDASNYVNRASDFVDKFGERLLKFTEKRCFAYARGEAVERSDLSLAFRLLTCLMVCENYSQLMMETLKSDILLVSFKRSVNQDVALAKKLITFIEKRTISGNSWADVHELDIFELLNDVISKSKDERLLIKSLRLTSVLILIDEQNAIKAKNLINPILNTLKNFQKDEMMMACVLSLHKIILKNEQSADTKNEIDRLVRPLCYRKPSLAYHAREVLDAIGEEDETEEWFDVSDGTGAGNAE